MSVFKREMSRLVESVSMRKRNKQTYLDWIAKIIHIKWCILFTVNRLTIKGNFKYRRHDLVRRYWRNQIVCLFAYW